MNTNSHNGLKILVSAVQFRPGTPGNAENVGERGARAPSGLSYPSSVSGSTGTTPVQAALSGGVGEQSGNKPDGLSSGHNGGAVHPGVVERAAASAVSSPSLVSAAEPTDAAQSLYWLGVAP